MDFEFSDEQRQLREAVEAFAAKEYTFERLRAIKRSGAGWDPAVWRGLAELGVTALNVPASLGGLGYGPTETLALMDACGPSLLLEPILTSAVIATALLRHYERDAGARRAASRPGRRAIASRRSRISSPGRGSRPPGSRRAPRPWTGDIGSTATRPWCRMPGSPMC